MKKIVKNIIAIMLIVIANIVSVYTTTYNVYADENIDTREFDKKNVFIEGHKKYGNVDKTVQKEVSRHSTVAKKEIEEYLNKQGVFDDEIAGLFTDEDLRELQICDLVNTEIYVAYYAVEDKAELEDCAVVEEEMIELTDEQVDKYLAEKYFSKETNLYEELEKEFREKNECENNSLFNELLEAVGLKPIVAYAAITKSETIGGVDDEDNPSMLKKIWMAKKSSNYILVNFEAVWTEMPKYRNLDVIYIEWDYGKYYEIAHYADVEVTHFWRKKVVYVSAMGKRVTENTPHSKQMKYVPEGQNLKNNQYNIREDYLCAAINLHNDYEGYSTVTMEDIHNLYVNEGVSFKFYVRPEEGVGRMNFYLRYGHTKVETNIVSVAVSAITGGKSGMLSAICELASGDCKTIKTELSGIDHKFIFNYK